MGRETMADPVNGSRPEDPARERILFGLLLLLQIGLYGWLILGRRLMRPHDTLFEYQLQYLFLAHSCRSAELALWLPTSLHGVVSNWFATFQGGLLQNVILLAGGVPEGTNMLPLFYLGKFFEEFLLLLGTWRLGRHLYASPYARFFVCAAVVGSCFWASHFSFNLKIFYGVPLLLSLLHDYLRDGRRETLLLASIFAALQFSGTITYIPVLTLLVVVAYAVIHALLFPALWAARFKALRRRPADLLLVLAGAAVVWSIHTVLSVGEGAMRHYRPGRGTDARVTLDAFLTYAATLNPSRYADFFFGSSPSMDYTIYCGAAVPVMGLGALLARPGRPVIHLIVCTLVVLFFSMGWLSLVAAGAYVLTPPLRFFRYVSLAAPLVKIFLILLAGHGIDAFVAGRLWRSRLLDVLMVPVALALGATLLLVAVARGGANVIATILGSWDSALASRTDSMSATPVIITGIFTLILAGVLSVARRGTFRLQTCVVVLLALQTVDVFRWKVAFFREETIALDDAQYALQQIRPLPFIARRSDDYERSDRYRALADTFVVHGARYDLFDAFCHVDPPLSRFWIHYWLTPFEGLVNASNGRPPDAKLDALPMFGRFASRKKGSWDEPYAKILGITADKIRVFREAHVVESDRVLAEALNNPAFKGDLLLLSPGPEDTPSIRPLPPDLLPTSQRIDVTPRIDHFDMNVLDLTVDLPPDPGGGWLCYSDVWDPGWTATVNGKPAAVKRAFLAYKAVKLEPGANVVRFKFQAPLRNRAYQLVGLASLFVVVSTVVLAVGTFRSPTLPPA
jgi:hypothetical protein